MDNSLERIQRAIPGAIGNRPGVVPAVGDNRSSQTLTMPLAAGSKQTIMQAGTSFYLIIATGKVAIKPEGGSTNTYTQGTGELSYQNPFKTLQVENPNSFGIIISIFVGFGNYIDNRVTLFNPLVSSVAYSTYGVANAGNNLLIPDLAGSAFLDADGVSWLALSREALYVSNLGLALTLNIQNTAANKTLLAVPPNTDIVYPANGNFRITDAAPLNMIVSEVYSAVRPGTF